MTASSNNIRSPNPSGGAAAKKPGIRGYSAIKRSEELLAAQLNELKGKASKAEEAAQAEREAIKAELRAAQAAISRLQTDRDNAIERADFMAVEWQLRLESVEKERDEALEKLESQEPVMVEKVVEKVIEVPTPIAAGTSDEESRIEGEDVQEQESVESDVAEVKEVDGEFKSEEEKPEGLTSLEEAELEAATEAAEAEKLAIEAEEAAARAADLEAATNATREALALIKSRLRDRLDHTHDLIAEVKARSIQGTC